MKNQLVNYWKRSGLIKDQKVLQAFEKVPRELFVMGGDEESAYADYPLPIHAGQTISQPTTVVMMTQALELKKGDKVLEVGTGSGYQAAVIAKIVGEKGRVISTEIIPELVKFAKSNLKRAGIKNVKVIESDGSLGYEREAPYDAIIVTAACPQIPEKLLAQLKTGRNLVAPVGSIYLQEVLKIRKTRKGYETESLGHFAFVPLKGREGF